MMNAHMPQSINMHVEGDVFGWLHINWHMACRRMTARWGPWSRGCTSADNRNAADTAPPEDTPAMMPSTRARARMHSSASRCVMSITLSTREASKIWGRYAGGHRRIPGIDDALAGCSPTICTSGFLLFRNLQGLKMSTPLSIAEYTPELPLWVSQPDLTHHKNMVSEAVT